MNLNSISKPYFEPHPDARNPVLSPADIDDMPGCDFVADPFIVHDEINYHLFFEAANRSAGNEGGLNIAHAVSRDGIRWMYDQVILEEPFNQSYPNVFNHEGKWYMTPASENKETRVYEAISFPTKWRHVASPIQSTDFGDPTPIYKDGQWWIFLQSMEKPNYPLHLFTANHIIDDWIEHPASPIESVACRPAGRPIVTANGSVLLFTRTDSDPIAVVAREIITLSDDFYEANLIHSPTGLGPSLVGYRWNGRKMHHVSATSSFPSHDIVAVDGLQDFGDWQIGIYRFASPTLINRFKHNLNYYLASIKYRIASPLFQL
jgi:hypothetical protein